MPFAGRAISISTRSAWPRSSPSPATPCGFGAREGCYKIYLDYSLEDIDAAFACLSAKAKKAGRIDSTAVKRARMTPRTTTIQRITQGDVDAETGIAIAAIVNEAAQKIERV